MCVGVWYFNEKFVLFFSPWLSFKFPSSVFELNKCDDVQ